ncbi:RagB/SusD family nutrient uptake outer membrane protein [Tamlana sp. I1]|uniref:RagB/SusD family nutrient uptake outer membrane protein n=1 Tax=Tamlana sp. I1 TaxID=2762061 RepID=UPI00188E8F74|nr:RagB/SusD family nutrient uptake outer membrane protein [Tamlana sp. I1]
MKTYQLKIAIILVAVSLSTIACSDDFVNVDPKFENTDAFFNTPDDYNKTLIGAYDALQPTFWNVLLGEIASDNTLAGGDPSKIDGPDTHTIDNMIPNDNNTLLRNIWQWNYVGLNRANYILEFQDNIDFKGKDNIIGQAYFLRAYFAFELVKWFGNVPLLTNNSSGTLRILNSRIKPGDQYTMNRIKDIPTGYALIEEDLKDAISKLNLTQNYEYQIGKGAAQALLGKVYLFHGKYDDSKFQLAADVLKDVIDSNVYSLVNDYNQIFENENENNIESLFEVQYTNEPGVEWGCLQCGNGNVAVGYSGIRDYPSAAPFFFAGYGYNTPTQEAVDEFEMGDLRKEVAILDIVDWASKNNGVTYTLSRGETGYYNRKYLPRKKDYKTHGNFTLNNPNNYRAIRYADVLLMAAEANNRKISADDSQAQDYLNQVRRRAFGVSDASHDVTLSGTALTDAIYHERRVELMGEGHRFFDLVRTDKAAQSIPGFTTNKNEIFPIPLVELELANAVERWGQNPNY